MYYKVCLWWCVVVWFDLFGSCFVWLLFVWFGCVVFGFVLDLVVLGLVLICGYLCGVWV